jgi:2-methylisocitrate lyase-like PEP mutase family enzyme
MRPDRAQAFRALHRGNAVLLLPNVWDAGSAAIFAAVGIQAIATSSAGVAWSCGYPDGDALPRASLIAAVGAICRVAGNLPVSADIESGFSARPQEVARLVCDLCDLGIAGINLEDGSESPDLLAAKIVAIKQAVSERGGDVFVNARTDVYLRELVPWEEALRETIARGRRYLQAGADGFFVPDLAEPQSITRVAESVAIPLNLLAVPGLAPAGELYVLGVRRLSAGSAPAKRAYGAAREAARAFIETQDAAPLFAQPAIEYREANALLEQDTT